MLAVTGPPSDGRCPSQPPPRLVAQTALHPGLASVCREALRQGPTSAAFRYAAVDRSTAGAPFVDAWRLCRAAGAWLVGVVSGADGRLVLNPSPRLRLEEGDELVALARGGEQWGGRLIARLCCLIVLCLPGSSKVSFRLLIP